VGSGLRACGAPSGPTLPGVRDGPKNAGPKAGGRMKSRPHLRRSLAPCCAWPRRWPWRSWARWPWASWIPSWLAPGPAAIGAGSLGGMLFYPVVISGAGVLLGMDTLVAQSFGANDPRDCRRTLVDGLWLATALSAPLAAVLVALIPVLHAVGINPRVMAPFTGYVLALLWGILPLLWFTALRRYLQA